MLLLLLLRPPSQQWSPLLGLEVHPRITTSLVGVTDTGVAVGDYAAAGDAADADAVVSRKGYLRPRPGREALAIVTHRLILGHAHAEEGEHS